MPQTLEVKSARQIAINLERAVGSFPVGHQVPYVDYVYTPEGKDCLQTVLNVFLPGMFAVGQMFNYDGSFSVLPPPPTRPSTSLISVQRIK